MQVRTIKIELKKTKTGDLLEIDLGLLFLNLAILSLLLPVFIEVLSADIKKSNYRSIDSVPSQSINKQV